MKISTDNSTIRNAFGDKMSLKLIKDAGFDGIDYTFYDVMPDNDILEFGDAEREALAYELKDYAKEIGIEFPQCHTELKYKYGTIEINPEHPMYRRVIRSLEYASRMGIPQAVIHDLRTPDDMPDEVSDKINREFILSFVPYAEKFGVKIGIENLFKKTKTPNGLHFTGRHHTAVWMNEFVDSLNNPIFVSCCDIGHAEICGSSSAEFISGMNKDLLTMLHVQDTDFKDDRHWLPFLGKHDWDAITTSLAKIGFEGTMNLEVLHYYEQFPKDLLPDALKLAAVCARKLADMTEAKMKELNR